MEQIYRIEIPVEVVDKSDQASLQRLEAALQRVFNVVRQNKTVSDDAFSAIKDGMDKVKTGAKGAASAAEAVSESIGEAGSAATEAGADQVQAAGSAENANKKLENAVEGVADAYSETSSAAAEAGQKSGSAFDKAGSGVDKFTQRMEKSNQRLQKMFREKLELTVKAIDKASPVLKTIWNTAKSFVGKTWSVAVKMKDLVTAPFRKLYNLISSPITIALSAAGIGLSVSDVVSTFNEFETGMSAVRSLTGATDEEFTLLKENAKELGATTSFSASEASQGMQYLAMAGWDTNEIIAAMPGLLDLAAAGATELGTAADIVSDVMTAMGMSAEQAGRAADVFAKTATGSNTTIEGLGDTLKYAAPIAHSFGMELEEVAALAGMMGNAGIKGSQAGTAMRSALLRMADPAADAEKWMKKLNLSFVDSSGKMKSMSTILRDTQTAFAGLTDSQKLSAAQAIFGTEAASAWLGVIDQGVATYDAFTDTLYNASGAAEEMANIRLDNLAGDVEELGGALETAKLEIMDKLNPYLRQGVQWLSTQIPGIQAGIENAIDSLFAKVQKLKDFFTGDDFQNADGFAEKFFLAWDKIIAEPFEKWWNGGGKEEMLNLLGELGEGAGELLNGIITGIFAAITGKEIGTDGMNLTGFAKAGAEAAKEFVSSFANGFDLGDVIDKAPGLLKLGVLGYGASKLGKAIGGDAIKKALLAIPPAAWPAVAAIGAVALAVYAYTESQKRQKEELLELGNAVERTTESFQQTAQQVNATVDELNSLNRERRRLSFVLSVAREGLTDEQIDSITNRLGEIEDDTTTLTLKIVEESDLTVEDVMSYAQQFALIEDDEVHLLASIIALGNTEKGKEVYALLEEYDLAQFDEEKKASVTAQILSYCEDPAKAQQVYDLLKLYGDPTLSPMERATAIASIIANTTGNTDPTTLLNLLTQYNDPALPESEKVAIEAQLSAMCADSETASLILPLFQQYGALESKETAIEATLTTNGVTSENIEDLKALAGLINERDTLTLALEGANLTPEELAEYEKRYEETLDKITALTNGAVDARTAEGEAIEANIALLEQQLGIEKEIAALKQQNALLELEGSMPEVIRQEQKSREKEASIQAEIDSINVSGNVEKGQQLTASYWALENERLQKRNEYGEDSDAYNQYMHGSYYDKAYELYSGYVRMYNPDATDVDIAREYSSINGGVMEGNNRSIDYLWNDGFVAAVNSLTENDQMLLDDRTAALEKQQQETAQFSNERMQYYAGMEAQQTGKFFAGTEYEGMSLKDIAENYSDFSKDPVMRAAFQDAVDALDSLNSSLIDKGWLSEEEATTVDQINAIRDASFAETPTVVDPVTGEPAVQTINIEQAIATLSTQNQMKNGDTRFTRDLAANTEAYNAALTADYGSDLERQEALKAIQLERRDILVDQQTAISTAIQGVEQLDGQIVEKRQAIADKQTEISGKNYEGAANTVREVSVAMREANFSGDFDAAAALEKVNTALGSLGIDKIESLDQLGQALESINSAQTADENALTALNDELAALETSRIELLVQATNALDSLTWNINQINGDTKLDDSLKINETTIGQVESLRSKLESTGGQASDVRTKVDNLKSGLDSLAGDYEVRVKYIFSSTQQITLPTGATKVGKNAEGGIYDGAMLSWVAEEGPEAIIPLSANRRERGLNLWLEAGRALGVSEFADGGILAPYSGVYASFADDTPQDTEAAIVPVTPAESGQHGGSVISVSVEVNPTYEIDGSNDPEAVLAVIREKQDELAELFGATFAAKIEEIAENMV